MIFRKRRSHLQFGTGVFLMILFSVRLNVCFGNKNRVDDVIRELKGRCFSKSNEIRDKHSCDGKPSCPRTFRKTTDCWVRTCAGEMATSPCPMLFFYTNVSLKAFCGYDGRWNFSQLSWSGKCTRLSKSEGQALFNSLLPKEEEEMERRKTRIYVIFSWLSVAFMVPSLLILFYFMDRKNVRFNLHKNLICAFLFRVVTFFIDQYGDLDRTSCNVFWVLNRFFAISEVSWMLNEAVFLLKLLFRAFDAKSYFWAFFAFGWGFPAILVFAVYVPVMIHVLDTEQLICWSKEKNSYYMFILYGPMTLMLLINFATLVYVIYVLLDKLKTSTTSELLRLKKGIKAALILMPLFGVIYLMILYVPTNAPIWYDYLIRILYPMQGTLASLVYVAFNGEVRQAMRIKWHRWMQTKSEFLDRVRPYRGIARVVLSTDSSTTTCEQVTDFQPAQNSCSIENAI